MWSWNWTLDHVRMCMDCSPPGSSVHGILQARILEWVAISSSSAWKWKVKVKSLSRVWLVATPWTAAHQAPPSMGFSRQEYWSGVPLPSPTPVLFTIFPQKVNHVNTGSELCFRRSVTKLKCKLAWYRLLRMKMYIHWYRKCGKMSQKWEKMTKLSRKEIWSDTISLFEFFTRTSSHQITMKEYKQL